MPKIQTPKIAIGAPRPLNFQDIQGLLDVQLACYGESFIESAEVYARRLKSPLNSSLMFEYGGQVIAYLVAYRSSQDQITPLHGDFKHQVCVADTLYLHDLAVLPNYKGHGLAQDLLTKVWAQGNTCGLQYTALVSVQGSQNYWERHGYSVRTLTDPKQCHRLASYGEGAVYMMRELPVQMITQNQLDTEPLILRI